MERLTIRTWERGGDPDEIEAADRLLQAEADRRDLAMELLVTHVGAEGLPVGDREATRGLAKRAVELAGDLLQELDRTAREMGRRAQEVKRGG